METQNIKEYELLREETLALRECITDYMGFVVGGSGAAMFGLAALRLFGQDNKIAVAYVAFGISLLLSFVLVILMYKFNSHNRYAAYSRLLADERYPSPSPAADSPNISWELCIERLRESDLDPQRFRAMARAANITFAEKGRMGFEWMLDTYVGSNPPVDRGKVKRGFRHLFLATMGVVRTSSWGFPPPIVAVFFVLTLIYIGIGGYAASTFLLEKWTASTSNPTFLPSRILFCVGVLVLAQLYLWMSFCGKLFTLMEGSATVDAYSFLFVATRADYLNQRGLTPSYPSTERLMIEQHSRSQPQRNKLKGGAL